MTNYYVIELSEEQVKLCATLVHLLLQREPDDKIAQSVIDDLAEQTYIVFKDPKRHGVGVDSNLIRRTYDEQRADEISKLWVPPMFRRGDW
jgi:hypothetical protein